MRAGGGVRVLPPVVLPGGRRPRRGRAGSAGAGPALVGPTSSPLWWWPSPASDSTTTRRCVRWSWSRRSLGGSGSGFTLDQWNGHWPVPFAPTVEVADEHVSDGDIERYEELRHRALCGDAAGWRLGLPCCNATAWPPRRRLAAPSSAATGPVCVGGARRQGRGGGCARHHGVGLSAGGVMGDDCRRCGLQGHRLASGPHRLLVCAPVDHAPGAHQHRVHHPPICAAATGRRSGLGNRTDRDHRPRPRPVGAGTVAPGVTASDGVSGLAVGPR